MRRGTVEPVDAEPVGEVGEPADAEPVGEVGERSLGWRRWPPS